MTASSPFEYADLFAGIGGFHAMLDHAGGRCVYVSEIDDAACAVYALNWVDGVGESIQPEIHTDITLAAPSDGAVELPKGFEVLRYSSEEAHLPSSARRHYSDFDHRQPSGPPGTSFAPTSSGPPNPARDALTEAAFAAERAIS